MSAEKPKVKDLEILVQAWCQEMGLAFNPFAQLEASQEPFLPQYVVEPNAGFFKRICDGATSAYIFARPGDGRTALWETGVHLTAINYEGSQPPLLPIPYKIPDWPVLALNRNEGEEAILAAHERGILQATTRDFPKETEKGFTYVSTVFTRMARETIRTTLKQKGEEPLPLEKLIEIVQTEGFKLCLFIDGVDAFPETNRGQNIDRLLAPLSQHPAVLEGNLLIKAFLPPESQTALQPLMSPSTIVEQVCWNPKKLMEIVDTRVLVASNNEFGLKPLLQYDTQLIISKMIKKIEKITQSPVSPRDILVVIRDAIEMHVLSVGPQGELGREDFKKALEKFRRQHATI